jgi:hypothetical protein
LEFYATHQPQLQTTTTTTTTTTTSVVQFHVLMEKSSKNSNYYPHNMLRQLALDHVQTRYFLQLDVDHLPIPNCHFQLRQLLPRDASLVAALANKTLMVLPAFDQQQQQQQTHPVATTGDVLLLPTTRQQVMDMIETQELVEFHMANFPPGHNATDFQTVRKRNVYTRRVCIVSFCIFSNENCVFCIYFTCSFAFASIFSLHLFCFQTVVCFQQRNNNITTTTTLLVVVVVVVVLLSD